MSSGPSPAALPRSGSISRIWPGAPGGCSRTRGESLTDAQKAALLRERTIATLRPSKEQLLAEWHAAVETALAQIGATPEAALTDARAIGRAQLPTTVGGAVFHAAEHAARHAGQIITTAMVIRASR